MDLIENPCSENVVKILFHLVRGPMAMEADLC